MGNQYTANGNLRKSAAIVKSGALGKVTEVHVWTDRPIWDTQGAERPKEEAVPEFLDWNAWLGPAKERPYGAGYHPFAWRGWWDFGTGALGDMACHTFNMPFMALNLRNPISVEAETTGHNKDSYPAKSKITFQFPETDGRPAVKVIWYDGKQLPDSKLFDGHAVSGTGSLIIGEKGKLHSMGDYAGEYKVYGVEEPKVEFVNSPGHFTEFVEAIKGGPEPVSNFPDYAGPLTETILLGNLAVYAAADGKPKKIEWDAKEMKVTNDSSPELAAIVKHTYREGWSL
jgi:predicted dehydrogenase